MREFKTLLVGEKKDVSGIYVRPKSDWELVDVYNDDGTFVMRGLQQNVPDMYSNAGFSIDTNACISNIAPSGNPDRRHDPNIGEVWLVGVEETKNINTPIFDGEGDISGYVNDQKI